jgi:hypothetical protein
MSTESQILANRQNALRSTGPRTPEGKAASSANATKHGLSAGFRVLDNENQDEFDELIAEYHRTLMPADPHQCFLVEEIVQARWRLARVRRLETELIADMVVQRGSADADAMMVSALRNDTTRALTTLQRYAATIQRNAFRAFDQLLASRRLEARAARDAARRNEPNLESPAGPSAQAVTSMSRESSATLEFPGSGLQERERVGSCSQPMRPPAAPPPRQCQPGSEATYSPDRGSALGDCVSGVPELEKLQ